MTDEEAAAAKLTFAGMVGQTLLAVEGAIPGSDKVTIRTSAGKFVLYHDQQCCETVTVESITGDPADLVDCVVRLAEVSTREDLERPEGTWTFYRLQTTFGDLDIRWFGESNNYSEDVQVRFEPMAGGHHD